MSRLLKTLRDMDADDKKKYMRYGMYGLGAVVCTEYVTRLTCPIYYIRPSNAIVGAGQIIGSGMYKVGSVMAYIADAILHIDLRKFFGKIYDYTPLKDFVVLTTSLFNFGWTSTSEFFYGLQEYFGGVMPRVNFAHLFRNV